MNIPSAFYVFAGMIVGALFVDLLLVAAVLVKVLVDG